MQSNVPEWVYDFIGEPLPLVDPPPMTDDEQRVFDALHDAGYPVKAVTRRGRRIGADLYTVQRTGQKMQVDAVAPTMQATADNLRQCISLGYGTLWSFELCVWDDRAAARHYAPGGNGRMQLPEEV